MAGTEGKKSFMAGPSARRRQREVNDLLVASRERRNTKQMDTTIKKGDYNDALGLGFGVERVYLLWGSIPPFPT